jgi:hypothetical protein
VDPVDLETGGPVDTGGRWVGVAFPPHLSMIGYRGA